MTENERVTAQAREAAARYPWYALLLSGMGRDPGCPPLLTATLLEKTYYAFPPAEASSLASYTTSGTSSGKRKTIYYSDTDEYRYIGIKADIFRKWLGDLAPPAQRVLSDMGTGHAAATAAEVFESIGLETESVSFSLPLERHLERLDQFRPDVLYTMPSILDRIVTGAGSPDRFGVRRIILVGEIAPPAWQRRMAGLFGIRESDILDTYGSIEIGTIAYFHHELGRYVMADGLTAETVGAEELGEGYDPLPPDEGVLVLTSHVRDEFPAVRYVTYDVIRDFKVMDIGGRRCGTFACMVKRIGPELKHGEKISLYDIEEAVLRHAADAVIRVEVRERRLSVAIRSKTLSADVLPAVQADIEDRIPDIGTMIRGGLLEGIEVSLQSGDGPHPSGGIKSRKIHYGKAG